MSYFGRITTLVLTLSFLFSPLPVLAKQESVIDTVLKIRESLVHINAVKVKTAVSPKAEARVIPGTNKIVIARNRKVAQFGNKGAGLIIDKNGYIITNFHTVKLANAVYVKLHDGSTYPAKIIHYVSADDLALLKINAERPLKPISFANSNKAQIGQEIIHIGTSELLNETISAGRITGIGRNSLRKLVDNITVQLIQVNLRLFEGDSGGPLLNKKGKLIGLIVAKNTKKDQITYAIPSNKIRKLCLDFMK